MSAMKESEIRPPDLFAEYLRLSAADAETMFDPARREAVDCPGCGGAKHEHSFKKHGFDYVVCQDCSSLFQTPRPPVAEYAEFYRDSVSAQYWADVFLPAVIETRRVKMFRPRAERIRDLCAERELKPKTVFDIGAGHGIALEEWGRIDPSARLVAVEPGAALAAACRAKGYDVVETMAEDASAATDIRGDLVTCFEVIEHVRDALTFARSLYDLTAPGGLTLVTGLGCDGFDIQLLWDRSNSISPPHHINFMSAAGFETLFKRAGFDKVEVITPGRLDVDIVLGALERGETDDLPRFERLLLSRGEACRQEFQQFLARHQLSSHCWVLASRS